MIRAGGERYINNLPIDVLLLATQTARENGRDKELEWMSYAVPRTYIPAHDPLLQATTYRDLLRGYWNYLANPFTPASGIPPHPGPLHQESALILPNLQAILNKGYLTSDSQPGALVSFPKVDGQKDFLIQSPYLFIITPSMFYDEIRERIDANNFLERINYPAEPVLRGFPNIPSNIRDNCIEICIGVRDIHLYNDGVALRGLSPLDRAIYLEFILSNQNPFFTEVSNCLPDITGQIGGGRSMHQKRKQRKTRRSRRS